MPHPSCSYDAGEDNEISFKEGERITQIEAASEDWWQGTNQLGHVGLFPGAYSPALYVHVENVWDELTCVAIMQRIMSSCRAEYLDG